MTSDLVGRVLEIALAVVITLLVISWIAERTGKK
jgi:hypothetical protein